MKKLYEKSEIWFSVLWIIIYVVAMGSIRNNFGDASPYSILVLLVIAITLTIFIAKNKLGTKYGLIGLTDMKKYLYFIPFVLLTSVNCWFGLSMHYDLLNQIFAVITMGLVGYVEEIIFRGLLYKAIEKDSIKKAIIISAMTFGAGHIVNLLTGHATLDTFLQIGYAIAIGFAFVMVFYKSGSLIPCIITHSLVNITSTFSVKNGAATSITWKFITASFIIVVGVGYALYLHKKVR